MSRIITTLAVWAVVAAVAWYSLSCQYQAVAASVRAYIVKGALRQAIGTSPRWRYAENAGLLGMGYNLLRAMPDAARLGSLPMYGSSDIGITFVHVFNQSWTQANDDDKSIVLPDHVTLDQVERECHKYFDYELVTGLDGYRKLLLANTFTGPRETEDCRRTMLGLEYQGSRSHSYSGKQCNSWIEGYGSRRDNSCRNPSKDTEGPWCLVGEEGRQETCAIPFCKPGNTTFDLRAAFMGPYYMGNTFKDVQKSIHDSIYFMTKTTCHAGRLTQDSEKVQVSETFKRQVCSLPAQIEKNGEVDLYHHILSSVGTHVVTALDMGYTHLERYDVRRSDIEHLVKDMSGTARIASRRDAATGLITQFLTLDLRQLSVNKRRELADKFGRNSYYKRMQGTKKRPKHYAMQLTDISEALNPKHWTDECKKEDTKYKKCCGRLGQIRENLEKAIKTYPEDSGVVIEKTVTENTDEILKSIKKPKSQTKLKDDLKKLLVVMNEWKEEDAKKEEDEPFPDHVLAVPLKWPAGYYSLPAVAHSCPTDQWHTGFIRHGTYSKNEFSKKNHLAANKTDAYVQQAFCTKGNGKEDGPPWPAGAYCIHRYGGKCPDGFHEGHIWWDDRRLGLNTYEGVVPDGDFGLNKNTQLQFCCRHDSSPQIPILLPSLRPFYLLKKLDKCQQVLRTNVYEEFIFWDSNDFGVFHPRSWQMGGMHPKNDYYHENNKLYYCYYQPESWNREKDESWNTHEKFFLKGIGDEYNYYGN